MAGGFFDQWLVDATNIALGVEIGPIPSAHRLIFCDGDWGRNATIATVANSEIDPTIRGEMDLPVTAVFNPVSSRAVRSVLTAAIPPNSFTRVAWVALDGSDIRWIIAGRSLAASIPAGERWDLNLTISAGLLPPGVAGDW